jgi:hypothetical protein
MISKRYGSSDGGSLKCNELPPCFNAPSIGVVKRKHVGGRRGMISSSLMPIDLKNRIIA